MWQDVVKFIVPLPPGKPESRDSMIYLAKDKVRFRNPLNTTANILLPEMVRNFSYKIKDYEFSVLVVLFNMHHVVYR
jgi:hypothetical protein